jgi:hypothetical protein
MSLSASLRRTGRRFERLLLGMAMSAAAFVIERRLLKAIRESGGKDPAPAPSARGVAVGGTPSADEG